MLALLNQLDHVLVCLIPHPVSLLILLVQVHVIKIRVDQVVKEVFAGAFLVFFLLHFVNTLNLLLVLLQIQFLKIC